MSQSLQNTLDVDDLIIRAETVKELKSMLQNDFILSADEMNCFIEYLFVTH